MKLILFLKICLFALELISMVLAEIEFVLTIVKRAVALIADFYINIFIA